MSGLYILAWLAAAYLCADLYVRAHDIHRPDPWGDDQ